MSKRVASPVPVSDAIDQIKSAGLGFERVEHIAGSTYKNSSTVIIIPTRDRAPDDPVDPRCGEKGKHVPNCECKIVGIHPKVISSWLSLIAPMNQKRAMLFASGHEVGEAYNVMIKNILAHPELSKWKYVMTMEDDNVQPADAHIRLLESIESTKLDAMSGIYFTKGDINMPMAYGDPDRFQRTGELEFGPRDVRAALAAGHIMKVNGIACGCALWRMDLFREIPPPWFVTVNDVIPGKGAICTTQDLDFCSKAVRAGKRFGVDLRVRVGHLDAQSGITY